MNNTLPVALIQHNAINDHTANLPALIKKIEEAAQHGAKLVVLQELHNAYYFPQEEDTAYYNWAETIPGPSTDLLGQTAKRLGVVIVASIFEERAKGLYHNTAVVLEKDGSIAGIYRKMHIPDDPGFYEKYYFTPGDLGFTPITTSVGKLGVLVCWDQWFPEGARLMALAGADMLIYPTAIGWHPPDATDEKERQLDAWITIQRAHAIANGLPTLVVNRVGFEANPHKPNSGIEFWGNSFIAGVQGEFLARADASQATILYADVDLNRTREIRQLWPYLRDRRIDDYSGLLKRFL
jgi:N-carbamoylputrescine amidase